MSAPTPRTDEAEEQSIRAYEKERLPGWPDFPCDGYDFARQLETAAAELAEDMTTEARKFNECAKNHGEQNRGAQAVADRAAEMLLRFAAQAKDTTP